MKWVIGAILATGLAAPACASGHPLEDRIRAIVRKDTGMDRPGCAIDLLKGGAAFLTVIDGAADVATRRPINADTQFYSASVAKQFTALAVAQLVVAGKVRLDDDIRKYLPEMPRYRLPVTVYMLLHHTSGIRDMLTLGAFAGYPESSATSRDEALRLVYSQTDTIFDPGGQFRYSNSGYLLLSEIVARASATPFVDYMRTHVFVPLGMSRSRVLSGARTTDANAAHGYAADGPAFKLADTHPYYGGSGGMVFTLRDLARYDRDIQVGRKVWTQAIEEVMLDPGKLADGLPAASRGVVYAAGLGLNGPWIQHGGAGEGFRNLVAWLPGGRLSIHVLCNNGSVDPAMIAEQIVDALASYPSLRPAMPPIDGRYASADLPVIYSLQAAGDAKLNVGITPRTAGLGRDLAVQLTKAADGAYTGDGLRILLDEDRAGFSLGDDRGRAGTIHFRREP